MNSFYLVLKLLNTCIQCVKNLVYGEKLPKKHAYSESEDEVVEYQVVGNGEESPVHVGQDRRQQWIHFVADLESKLSEKIIKDGSCSIYRTLHLYNKE